jgi:hypothetical protein
MNNQDLIDEIIDEFGGVFTGKLPKKFNPDLDIRITTSADGKTTIHATAVGISLTEDQFNRRAKKLALSNLPTKKSLSMPTFKGSGFSFGIKKINDDSFVVKISEDTHFARVFIDKGQALQISEWISENLK